MMIFCEVIKLAAGCGINALAAGGHFGAKYIPA
jgi:hypothetical protein